MKQKIIVDIDGTICTTKKIHKDMHKNYKESIPRNDVIEIINKLYDKGNTIIYYSARHWVDFDLTVKWMKNNNVKYHTIVLGKPVGHVYIDEDKKLLTVEKLLEINGGIKK